MPSRLLQENSFNFSEPSPSRQEANQEKADKKSSKGVSSEKMNWLSLFAELDPLANPAAVDGIDHA